MRFIACCVLILLSAMPVAANEETFSFGQFDKVTVYRGDGELDRIVMFFSGDRGWNLGVIDMSKNLVEENSLVIGIDINSTS